MNFRLSKEAKLRRLQERREIRALEKYEGFTAPERNKDRSLRKEYGIGYVQFLKMLVQQELKCAICGQYMKKPCIDHNHTTKEVRGLLCRDCNIFIGFAKENSITLENAISYLKKYNKSS